jgi:hypothetical protein
LRKLEVSSETFAPAGARSGGGVASKRANAVATTDDEDADADADAADAEKE